MPRLLAVTDDRVCAADDFPIRVAAILAAGSGVGVVVRAPGATTAILGKYLARVRALARPTEAATIVHGDPALGRLSDVQGVHLEAGNLELASARAALGLGWVGVSVRSLEEADRAVAQGADYLIAEEAGTTATSSAASLDWLRAVASRGAPVFAAAGVTPERVGRLAAAGAWGIVGTDTLWSATDPARATAELLTALNQLG